MTFAITDAREQNLWYAFISAYLGGLLFILYDLIRFLTLNNGVPSPSAENYGEFEAMRAAAVLSVFITTTAFVGVWATLRRSWRRRQAPLNPETRQEIEMPRWTREQLADSEVSIRAQLRKHRLFFLLAIALLTLMLCTTWLYHVAIFSSTTDEYARYSFVMSGLTAISLAISFWYLQKQDSDKMQRVLDRVNRLAEEQAETLRRVNEIVKIQAHIAEDERSRQKVRKEFWVNVAVSHLVVLESELRTLRDYYHVILHQTPTRERVKDIEELIALDRYSALNNSAPTLKTAMSQIADKLDDVSLFRDMDIANITWPLETADVHTSAEKMKVAADMIEVTIENLNALGARLKKELPAEANRAGTN